MRRTGYRNTTALAATDVSRSNARRVFSRTGGHRDVGCHGANSQTVEKRKETGPKKRPTTSSSIHREHHCEEHSRRESHHTRGKNPLRMAASSCGSVRADHHPHKGFWKRLLEGSVRLNHAPRNRGRTKQGQRLAGSHAMGGTHEQLPKDNFSGHITRR